MLDRQAPGKSTLLNLLIGFIQPTSGTIYLDEQPLTQVDMRSVRQFLAVVPQTTLLFLHQSEKILRMD